MATYSCSGALICHFVNIFTIIIPQVLGVHNLSVQKKNLKYYNSTYINEVANQGTTTTISNHYCV